MKRIINIILLLIWCLIIFLFSSQNSVNSTNTSNAFTKEIIEIYDFFSINNISQEDENKIIENSIMVVRKAAHITEYFILGLLMLNVLKDYKTVSKKMVLISIGLCFIYAITDEVHQLFVSGRTGKVVDVFIDSIGFILASIIYYIYLERTRKKLES